MCNMIKIVNYILVPIYISYIWSIGSFSATPSLTRCLASYFMNLYTDSSLLVYRNATDFWMFPLYSAVLWNSFILFVVGVVETLGFSTHRIIPLENGSNFIFLHSNLDAFYFSMLLNCSG